MEIRQFEGKADVRGIIRVHGLGWRAAYDGLLPDSVLQELTVDPSPEEIQEWQANLQANREGVLVAVDETETVRGFLDLRWGDSETKTFVGDDEAGLRAIYVDPDYYHQGIGTALLERGLEALPESIAAVRLEMLQQNDLGAQFYEAKGFEQTGTGEYEIDGQPYPTTIYTLDL